MTHTCALRGEMSVRCWGSNVGGMLGDGTTTDRLLPTGRGRAERCHANRRRIRPHLRAPPERRDRLLGDRRAGPAGGTEAARTGAPRWPCRPTAARRPWRSGPTSATTPAPNTRTAPSGAGAPTKTAKSVTGHGPRGRRPRTSASADRCAQFRRGGPVRSEGRSQGRSFRRKSRCRVHATRWPC